MRNHAANQERREQVRLTRIGLLTALGLASLTHAQSIPQVPAAVVDRARNNVYGAERTEDPATVSSISVEFGKNIMIPVALGFTNRFVTPFADPVVVSTSLSMAGQNGTGEVLIRNNTVYVSTTKDYPVTMFITQRDSEQYAISLTLLPRRIPPREIVFTIDGYTAVRTAEHKEPGAGRDDSRTAQIKSVLRAVALNEIPSGFELQNITPGSYRPDCSGGDAEVSFDGGQLLTGSRFDVLIGTVRNRGTSVVQTDEKICAGRGTAAVALWPRIMLQPGESTEIYVVTDKSAVSGNDGFRPNLLRGK